MENIDNLIDRLAAAECGNSELSEAMAVACGWLRLNRAEGPFSALWIAPDAGLHSGPPLLTTSLDAILTEIERVFPRCVTKHYRRPPDNMLQICTKGVWSVERHATSLPLAACMALLQAIKARDKGVGNG